MFRELTMVDTRELMRLWLKGYSDRAIARLARADRKTVKRYLKAAEAAGVRREGGEEQLGDEVLGAIAEVPCASGPPWVRDDQGFRCGLTPSWGRIGPSMWLYCGFCPNLS
jgi:hypothetical protein